MDSKRSVGNWRFYTLLLFAVLFFIAKKMEILDVSWILLIILWFLVAIIINVFILTKKEIETLALETKRSRETPLHFGMLSFILPPGFLWNRIETGQQIAIDTMKARYHNKFFINFNMSRQTPGDEYTVDGMKRLVEKFVKNEIGGKLIKNDIGEIAGIQTVDFEYQQRGSLHTRKIIFFYHLNEYRITIGEKVPGALKKLKPLIDAFLDRLAIVTPPFKVEKVLGDRVEIRMPVDQWHKTLNGENQVIWEKHPNQNTHAKVRLSYIKKAPITMLSTDLFSNIDGSLFAKGVKDTILWTPLDMPMTILFAQAPDDLRQVYQYSFGIQLNSGLLLLLDYFYEGDAWEHGLISNMYFVTFALEIAVTLSEISE